MRSTSSARRWSGESGAWTSTGSPVVGWGRRSEDAWSGVRESLAARIKATALTWGLGLVEPSEIDRLNIHQASLLAMRRAVEALSPAPDRIPVDGLYCPKVGMPARAIVKGDASEPCIAAASILAKTARDAEMLCLHASYPEYGLDRHKGYPTAFHLAALAEHGPAVIHRRSFAPVLRLLEGEKS